MTIFDLWSLTESRHCFFSRISLEAGPRRFPQWSKPLPPILQRSMKGLGSEASLSEAYRNCHDEQALYDRNFKPLEATVHLNATLLSFFASFTTAPPSQSSLQPARLPYQHWYPHLLAAQHLRCMLDNLHLIHQHRRDCLHRPSAH